MICSLYAKKASHKHILTIRKHLGDASSAGLAPSSLQPCGAGDSRRPRGPIGGGRHGRSGAPECRHAAPERGSRPPVVVVGDPSKGNFSTGRTSIAGRTRPADAGPRPRSVYRNVFDITNLAVERRPTKSIGEQFVYCSSATPSLPQRRGASRERRAVHSG